MYLHAISNADYSHTWECDHQVLNMFGQGKSEDENRKMLDAFNTDNQLSQRNQGECDSDQIWEKHIVDDKLPHIWHQQ